MRMSVTFKSDGIEFLLTSWGYASRSAKRPSPAAAAPVLRSERRPIAFSFVDIYSPFRHQTYSRLEPVHSLIRLWYPKLSLEADARPPRARPPRGSILVQLRRLDCAGVRKWRRPLPRTAQLRRERRFERPRRGAEDQGRAARARNGGTGGRLRRPGQGEARGVRPPHHAVPSPGKAERWPLADLALQTGDHLPIRQPVYEVGGRRFRGALLPTEIPASREPGLRLNPQLRRIPAEMPADLKSAEIAKSGSYFDDVTRDPRPYGIENTTDKVRRPGAVPRRRDAVFTERIVAYSYKAQIDPAAPATS